MARQGHVTLLKGDARPDAGDTPAMIEARAAFLAAGHFAPIEEAVADAAESALASGPPGPIVDIGAGTGHYLTKVRDRLRDRDGIALDVSPAAARRAAQSHTAVVCDVWRAIPIQTGTAALALNVFAPRNGAEMRRILHPDGALIVVTPTERHLRELIEPLGLLNVDDRKRERIEEALGPYFNPTSSTEVEIAMDLTREDIARLVAMGPSARHTKATADRATKTTASVTVTAYAPG
jgi:23S rRNA (guanine745-N1)-methyltransferase